MINFAPQLIVVILNKNHEKSLGSCLDSLINQSYEDFVVLVVDGNSTDGSISILEDFSARDTRIKYFIQASEGIGCARNEALEFIRSHFLSVQKIVWGDSENLYDRHYLRNMNSATEDIVGGANLVRVDSMLGQALWWLYVGVDGKGVLGHNLMVKFKLYKSPASTYPKLIAMDDYFLYTKLASEGASISFNPLAICYVRTVESFREFINWHKRKLKGLIAGFSNSSSLTKPMNTLKSSLKTPNIKLFAFFNSLEAALMLMLLMVKVEPSYLISLFTGSLLLLSFYLWIKGHNHVINMKPGTIFLMSPLFLYHYWITIISSLSGLIWGKLTACLKKLRL